MSSKDLRLNLYRFLICGLAIGSFVSQTNAQGIGNSSRLSGFYQLEISKSENINTLVENVSRKNNLSPANINDLKTKLDSPATVSLEIIGTKVFLSSANGNPVLLTADGSVATSYGSNGTKVSIRSSLVNDTLRVSSIYDNTNYSIAFKSLSNGRGLRVIRTIATNYLQQTVFAVSYYKRTSSPPIFNESKNGNNISPDGSFLVPYGTVLTVVLENPISTKTSQNNDVFRATVLNQDEYEGAMIEGYLSGIERTNGISGTAKMTLNFKTIKLRTGQTYDFVGVIQSIADQKGTSIKSSGESQIKSKNKTNESIKRSVLGAGIGAVIGAAISGKNGAWIGALIGGGAGTGTVFLEGKNDLELKRGSQIHIQSTSPN